MTAMRWVALTVAILTVVTLALGFGAVALSPAEVWEALTGGGDPTSETIVRTIRLPRILLGLLVGAGLAGSGTALQAALRNPLAEPYLLGVSGGAALGAVVAVSVGAEGAAIPIAAFVGALLAVQTVLMVARAAGGRTDPRILLMSGVVVGAFCTAAIMVALVRTPEGAVRGALWWMMGSLGDAR
jgi:iron complex transport system permease protein